MFGWAFFDGDGQELGGCGGFADADAAEAWIGTSWSDLLDRGIEEVALIDHGLGRRVYRMGLRDADRTDA